LRFDFKGDFNEIILLLNFILGVIYDVGLLMGNDCE
jgi:hypothetical protein